jgi:RecA-family ATPase
MTILTPTERARLYTKAMPPAISGSGGHSQTFALAVALAHGFNLHEADCWGILQEYNTTCSPPWGERELRHKMKDAYNTPHTKPLGWLLQDDTMLEPRKMNASKTSTVTQSGKFKVNLGSLAEVPTEKIITTEQLLLNAFKEDEIICITNEAGQDDDGRWFPASKGTFQTVRWWLDNFLGHTPHDRELFSPKPQGAYIRINPIKEGDISGRDDGIAVFRHLLVEFDTRPKEEQYAIFKQSQLPIAAIIDSGGKSLHAWVRIDAKDFEEWKERRQAVFDYLADYEPDEMTKNPSRWSRLGGVFRGDKEQRIVALNVGVANWDEWLSYLESAEVPEEVSIEELENFDVENDPTTVLGNRWLCKGGSLCVIGQSGIGKSSFLMQFAIMLAIGRPFFGVEVKRPYKCIVMNAENDTGDLAEAFKGIVSSMSLTEGEKVLLRKNIKFYRETVKVGLEFVKQARRLIVHHKADFFFADPLLAFAGGDISNQAYSSQFLRNWIQPVLMETGVVWVFLHHTGKPKKADEASAATVSDLAYSGLGSSELVNWSREVAVLRRTDKIKPWFELVLTKRGKRAGILDKDGKPTAFLNLRHAEGRILWEVNDENILNNFTLKDLQKMEAMPPTEHSNEPSQSMFVRYVEKKLAIGTAAAADVVNHLIRLSANNPIVVWDNRKSLWVGSKHSESNGNNPF